MAEPKCTVDVAETKTVGDVEATKKLLDESVRMLNKCYQKVTLDHDDESDTEDDKLRFAYRPINPYEDNLKRRAYIIGTKEWLEKHHIGLQSSEDDDAETDEEAASETESHLTDVPQPQQPVLLDPMPDPVQYFVPPIRTTVTIAVPQINIPNTRSIPINSSANANAVVFSDEPPEDTISVRSRRSNLFTESDDENENFLPVQEKAAPRDEPDRTADSVPAPKPLGNDFFNQNLSRQIANQAKAAIVARKPTNLFEDSDDDEEPVTPIQKVVPTVVEIPTEIEYTLHRNENVRTMKKVVEPVKVLPPETKDNLQQKEKATKEVCKMDEKPKQPKKKITNLFDDDSDDDFFLPIKAKKEQPEKKIEEVKVPGKLVG